VLAVLVAAVLVAKVQWERMERLILAAAAAVAADLTAVPFAVVAVVEAVL